jgi:peptidoglycan/xylan/chitin deacetylase (PgdA/CDA1 family)
MVSWLRANGKILFRGAALLLAGAAAGFGLGLFFAVPAGPGCQESDLTPVPDTGFASPAPEAAPASSLPQEEPVPEKWVCLTFDDGPSKTTQAVLDALNAAGVKATFFVVATGYNEKYLPLIADAAAAGHQIALHSASHEYSGIYQSADAYWQDIELLKERISPYVNTASLHYLRFPGGSTNTVSHRYGGRQIMQQLKAQAEQKGYAWIDWNVCAEDATASHPNAAQILRNVQNDAKDQPICVVLMHDTNATHETVKALPDILEWFAAKGYRFFTVQQMVE